MGQEGDPNDSTAAGGAAQQDGDDAAGSKDPIPSPPPATPMMDPLSAQRFLDESWDV